MKGRSILSLIVNLAVISQSIFTQSLAVESKKDTVTPSQQEARAILQAICDRDKIFANSERGGKLACRTCPSFITGGGIGGTFTLEKVVYGSFTQAGTREALADFYGCEPHSRNYGGSV